MATDTTTSEQCWQALRDIHDPELGFSIVDLGLIYQLTYDSETRQAHILMTLTSAACPLQAYFEHAVTGRLQQVPEVATVELIFTLTPPWSMERAIPAVQEHFALLGLPLTRW
jgi:metal-sulfur cluster biosynthetic enzyme